MELFYTSYILVGVFINAGGMDARGFGSLAQYGIQGNTKIFIIP